MRQPAAGLPLLEAVRPILCTRRFGRALRGFAVTTSTNTEAANWAGDGAPEGGIVLAEQQTAGRGRFGRRWETHPGQNLTFSLILRPTLPPTHLGLITLAACVGVAESLREITGPCEPAIKWPNDLMLNGRKCCGMLLEASLYPGAATPSTVVLGIGLNVNQAAFPPALAPGATSILLETGRLTDRAALLADLLLRIERAYESLAFDGGRGVREAYLTWLVGREGTLCLHLPGTDTPVSGRFHGITESGALVLHTDTGPRTFHAGEVSARPAP